MSFLLRMKTIAWAIWILIWKLWTLWIGSLYLLQYILGEVCAFPHHIFGCLRMVKVRWWPMAALATHQQHHIVLTVQSIDVLVVALTDGTSPIPGVRLSRSTRKDDEVNIIIQMCLWRNSVTYFWLMASCEVPTFRPLAIRLIMWLPWRSDEKSLALSMPWPECYWPPVPLNELLPAFFF